MFPLLSALIFIPLLGALFVLLIRGDTEISARNAKSVGLLTAFVTFILSLFVWSGFDGSNASYQWVEKLEWMPSLKMTYHLGVDGISLPFVLLTTFLVPLALLQSWGSVKTNVKKYVLCFLLLESMMIGAFCALDMILFYVFFEGVLIPMFLIIGIWGGDRRVYSAFKLFLYTLLGSVFMLIAILSLYSITGTTDIPLLQSHSFDFNIQFWMWLAFFASFAVKIPMWPFHTWLPDAHVEAPTAGSVILAGILLKMGGYGFLRISLPMFPEACQYFAPFIFFLSVIAVIYTSLIALIQKDMKKLIAYSSVAHMGFVTFGLFTFTLQGVQGAIFQMVSHGLVSAALFMCVGVLYDRVHSREIARYGGVAKVMPMYAVVFMIFTLASIGLPGTSGFVGEILILVAAFSVKGILAFLMGLGMILGAAYALWLYRRVMLDRLEKKDLENLKDLFFHEKSAFLPLVLLVIFFGVYPTPLLKMSESAVVNLLKPFEAMRLLKDASFEIREDQEL